MTIQVYGFGLIVFLFSCLDRRLPNGTIWDTFKEGVPVEYYPMSSALVNVPGELRKLLEALSPNLDDDSKRTTLHNITQYIYLKESEANICTNDDIKLVASFLDDDNKVIKTEALNALKAFTIIWRFKIKIQEYVPKVAELVTNTWDTNLQVAGLRLLNGLHIPDNTHPLMRRLLSNFMDILLMANTLAKVQVLKFLSTLAQEEDLLYDIMNSQAPPEFLSLFQPSLPGNLLCELLIFVERLSAGRLSPQYQSVQWQYNDNSLHEVIFGDNSRLSDRLLALIIHPEEEVQTEACKVILSLRLNKEESRVLSGPPFGANISVGPLESTGISQANTSSLSNHPLNSRASHPSDTVGNDGTHDESDLSFYPLQTLDDTGHSFHPMDSGRIVEDNSRSNLHPVDCLDNDSSSI
uniref:Armadillo repeat-containing domain-containing protein n=1 Tax=Anolis carolinensis TaxID=28377 RepID=H9GNY7_ANOCA|nr:PREDICTED: armadillo repeat-containing protein 12 isoform X1 [Anolis carolinensis]|eukprot:XP_008117538.2 PREDICTED: armadillo repeat-containing protein 12 isoform X1 [Anolis carolinensis]